MSNKGKAEEPRVGGVFEEHRTSFGTRLTFAEVFSGIQSTANHGVQCRVDSKKNASAIPTRDRKKACVNSTVSGRIARSIGGVLWSPGFSSKSAQELLEPP